MKLERLDYTDLTRHRSEMDGLNAITYSVVLCGALHADARLSIDYCYIVIIVGSANVFLYRCCQ